MSPPNSQAEYAQVLDELKQEHPEYTIEEIEEVISDLISKHHE